MFYALSRWTRHCVVGFCVLLLTLSVGAQEALDDMPFLMTFIPNIQFSPLYVAIEEGYFAEAGVQPVVEYLNEPDVIDLVAAGQAPFGVVGGEQVILARANGRQVVYVYEWFQSFPVGIVVSADSGITSVEALRGRKVSVPGRFGATYTGFTALMNNAGMTETDVQLEEIGFNAPDVFCLGVIDAATVYINNEPLQIRNRAQANECGDVTDVVILSDPTTASLLSNGIITREELIASDPDFVRAIVRAYDKGNADVINNPARAYLISLEYVENLPINDDLRAFLEAEAEEQAVFLESQPDREAIAASRQELYARLAEQFDSETLIQFQVLLATIDLWDAEQRGLTMLESWEATQDTLLAMGLLDAPINLEEAFTNDFVLSQDE